MAVPLKTSAVLFALLVGLGLLNAAQADSGADKPDSAPPATDSGAKNDDDVRVLKVGGGVSPPKPTYSPDPEYSEEARKAKYDGTCVLSLVVGSDGNPRDVKVTRPLGKGLDGKAVEAVKKWKFEPARKDGQPVSVLIHVEVSFHLDKR
jgi:TonB family protein